MKSSFMKGKNAEHLALEFLTKKGLSFINQRYRTQKGEIDLIMQKHDILIFVEVKARWSASFGSPEEAVTKSKKQKMLKTICQYLSLHPEYAKWRCDVVAIQYSPGKKSLIKHFIDIFNY